MSSRSPGPPAGELLRGVRAVTFDFGNTLAPVTRAGLDEVTERTIAAAARGLAIADLAVLRLAWDEERQRQLREDVPAQREMDLELRAIRIVARLRGLPPPRPGARWDDDAARAIAPPAEVAIVTDAYSRAFLEAIAPAAGAGNLIADLAGRGFRLAILSNWPFAATIDRYAAAAGWSPHLAAVVVSQRVGVIKPHPAIFAVAAAALAVPPDGILHVGDDWAADVVGAREAGWRVAYLRGKQGDTPLPTSSRTAGIEPDLELNEITDLATRLADPSA